MPQTASCNSHNAFWASVSLWAFVHATHSLTESTGGVHADCVGVLCEASGHEHKVCTQGAQGWLGERTHYPNNPLSHRDSRPWREKTKLISVHTPKAGPVEALVCRPRMGPSTQPWKAPAECRELWQVAERPALPGSSLTQHHRSWG